MQSIRAFRPLLVSLGVLALSACAGEGRNEPVFALVDRTQRIVAVAGQSQLGGAPSGSEVRAVVDGREQTLMVAERVGTGPTMRATPVAAVPVMASVEISQPVTSAALPSPEPAQQARRSASRRVVASEPGVNTRTGRRAGPTSRAISRSVM